MAAAVPATALPDTISAIQHEPGYQAWLDLVRGFKAEVLFGFLRDEILPQLVPPSTGAASR